MRTRFYVIPTQGRDQAILGREFMRQFPISFEINAYTQSVLVPAEVDERPSEVVLERERKAFAFSMARVKLKRGETKHVKMRARGKLPKDGRVMCVMPSDREERFLAGRTLLDPAKEDLFLSLIHI